MPETPALDHTPAISLRALVVAIASGDLSVTDAVVAKVDELAIRCGIGAGRLGEMLNLALGLDPHFQDECPSDGFDCLVCNSTALTAL